ncbi:DUF2231 domain-containing protein [Dictyobacter formicarum]|uniref:Rieske domain-containing protein n=1 Tax=Dictyobacter formicarum TaxID=2778368 RepID=A0ABQ3VPY7_9CHLR|nr:DUF2231 domain-containing protein [Dictyobacter formicarum]GHO87744.1 hypothetical protein KSZ_57500 [Dictyobacter formicarum]
MVADTTKQNGTTTSWMNTPPRSPLLRHYSAKLVASMPWLDKLSTPLQSWSKSIFGNPKDTTYRVKDFLVGVWLGHPVHPALVAIPIGAWTSALVFDLAWLGSDDDEGMARSADMMMWLGLVGAAGSAATGLANWVDTDGQEQRTGMLHAVLNGGATVLNLSSALLRLSGQRRTAIALASTAYALILYSSYLGGELAYSNGIGMNRVIPEGGPDEFVAVMDEKDLVEGKLTRVDVEGMPVVLLKDRSTINAIAATCSHLGGPLDEGSYEDGVVHCPWHNSGFRMSDGCVMNSPAVYAQPTFAVRVRDGKIELRRLEHA